MKKINNYNSKIFKIISSIVEIVFIIFVVLLCSIILCQKIFSKNNSLFGYRIFTIVTGSMEPKLKVGDIVLVKSTNFDKIKIGDYLTYEGVREELKDKVITHEVVDIIDEDGKKVFYTKGIASKLIDPAVYENQVYGVVTYKFFILSVMHKIITNVFGFILCIVIPLLYIMAVEIKSLVDEKNKAKIIDQEIKEKELKKKNKKMRQEKRKKKNKNK